MNEQNYGDLLPIIKKYFESPVKTGFSIDKISKGSTNETYKVIVEKKPYILQKLSKKFTKEVCEDMAQVTDYLNLNNIKSPNLLETKKGKKYVIEQDQIYRMYPFVYGESPKNFELSNNHLRSLGTYLSDLHKALEKLDYEPKHTASNTHNTANYVTKIKSILNKFEDKQDVECINAMIETYKNLDKTFLEEKQLIHGDTKIENVLYDKKFNEFAIIDFDTIQKASKFVDIGDLCRSLFISEDFEEIAYLRKAHEKFIVGYYMAMVKNTQKLERISKEDFTKQCIDATILISLELSLRFYIDVIEDNYFEYNSVKFASRKEHNLIRAQNCYELFRIIHKDNY